MTTGGQAAVPFASPHAGPRPEETPVTSRGTVGGTGSSLSSCCSLRSWPHVAFTACGVAPPGEEGPAGSQGAWAPRPGVEARPRPAGMCFKGAGLEPELLWDLDWSAHPWVLDGRAPRTRSRATVRSKLACKHGIMSVWGQCHQPPPTNFPGSQHAVVSREERGWFLSFQGRL